MAPELGSIGPITIRTYTLLLDAAIIIGLLLLAWFGWQRSERPAQWVDAGLWTLAAGLVSARLGHVAIHWGYFAEHVNEIPQIWLGGLDWHLAVLGGMVALAIYQRNTNISWKALMEAFALIVPIGAVFMYTGCLMVSCGHGTEVITLADYPPLIAAELPDLYGVVAPRLVSQGYGIAWSVIVLALSLIFAGVFRQKGLRFWLVLALLSLGIFLIGFTRGDAVRSVGPLRLDQVLDIIMMLIGLVGFFVSWQGSPASKEQPDQGDSVRILGAYHAD